MQATLEESLDAARLQLQDAEFLAAVLDIHVRETIEAMNLILALEGEGIIEEMTADLRLLAQHDPKTAEQPIMIPSHIEDWDHPGPYSLITIGKRIQSLTGFPDIIRFLHYEGKLLLANPGSASPARPEQIPLPLLRAHVRLLRRRYVYIPCRGNWLGSSRATGTFLFLSSNAPLVARAQTIPRSLGRFTPLRRWKTSSRLANLPVPLRRVFSPRSATRGSRLRNSSVMVREG